MKNRLSFPMVVAPEENGTGYTVTFPDLPEAITGGFDSSEALSLTADCLEEAIAGRIVDGREIPEPSDLQSGQYLIPCPAPTAAKAALYLAMKQAGLSKAGLAARLGVDEKVVRRLLDPRHQSRFRNLTVALELLGQRLVVDFQETESLVMR